jgi:acyl dehydratase
VKRQITAADIGRFAELSGDHHRLHTDAAFAARTGYGEPIAHGLLTAAAASGLLYAGGIIGDDVEALLEVTLRFVAPVFAGDEIVDETRMVESRVTSAGKTLERYASVVSGRDGSPVLHAEWVLLRSPVPPLAES